MSAYPWHSAIEYEELHDKIEGWIIWDGTVETRECPHASEGRARCAEGAVGRRSDDQDCPRFGGCDPARAGMTRILCKPKRFFDACEKNEPISVGAKRNYPKAAPAEKG